MNYFTRKIAGLIVLATLAGCAQLGLGSAPEPSGGEAGNQSQAGQDQPLPQNNKPASRVSTNQGGNSTASDVVIRGTGTFWREPAAEAVVSATLEADGVTLNFVDAEIGAVTKAVLGDILNVNYVIDPKVTGTITLQSSRPVPRDDVLAALENAYALSGIALLEQNDAYQILPLADAKRRGATLRILRGREAGIGYGIQVVPLRYVRADEMERVIRPLLPSDSIVNVDESRNLIFLSGTTQELSAGLEAIELFDVNWLEGMSFGLLIPKYAGAEVMVEELTLIFDNAKNPMAGLVELVPIPRINAILVMTAEPKLITEVRTWMDRLDKRGEGPTPQIFIYYVQHGDAEEITSSLTAILSNGSSSGYQPSSVPQSAPPTLSSDQNNLGSTTNPSTRASSPNPIGAAGTISLGEGSNIQIVANTKNNAIMVYANAREYDMIEEAIKQLDVPVDQVLIEAVIAEVRLTDELRYGVQWLFKEGDSSYALASNTGGAPAAIFPGFAYTYTTPSASVALNALASLTDVQVLSSPKLVILNNKTATLQVGDQVPVATQSAVSTADVNAPIVNTVQLRDTGVILEVTPHINRGGMVLLEIAQEVSNVVSTTTSGIDSPTIQQRKINSTVVIEDGRTMVLGGLMQETDDRGNSGVPFLRRIPLLGEAFKSTSKTKRRTELLIFLTPRVIHNMQDAQEVNRYLKDKLRHTKYFDQVSGE